MVRRCGISLQGTKSGRLNNRPPAKNGSMNIGFRCDTAPEAYCLALYCEGDIPVLRLK